MNFISKTMKEIASFISNSIYGERYASMNGLMQKMDARVKIVIILSFIFLSVYTSSMHVLLILFFIAFLLSILSRIPVRHYLLRVFLFVPLFTSFVAIPSIFSFVTPGESMVNIGNVSITYEGVKAAMFLIARVTVAVSFSILLITTTRWNEIMESMLLFRIPKIFVMIADMSYRYIFFLLKSLQHTLLSARSRALKGIGAVKAWRIYAPVIGAMFIKAHELNEKVYLSMISRGYGGEVRQGERFFEAKNIVAITAAFFIVAVIVIL